MAILNEQVRDVIRECKEPELAGMLIEHLLDGRFSEEQEAAALTLLQAWDIDLFDLGMSVLSDKAPDELRKIARGE